MVDALRSFLRCLDSDASAAVVEEVVQVLLKNRVQVRFSRRKPRPGAFFPQKTAYRTSNGFGRNKTQGDGAGTPHRPGSRIMIFP